MRKCSACSLKNMRDKPNGLTHLNCVSPFCLVFNRESRPELFPLANQASADILFPDRYARGFALSGSRMPVKRYCSHRYHLPSFA